MPVIQIQLANVIAVGVGKVFTIGGSKATGAVGGGAVTAFAA